MKKSNLVTGIVFIMLGIALLLCALLTQIKFGSMLFGAAGACFGSGIAISCKYFYWSTPENRERYKERLENETIELHDERKEKLRDKAGRYSYLLGLVVVSASIVIFSILGKMGQIQNARLIVLFLGSYFIFQIAAGILIFKHLNEKY